MLGGGLFNRYFLVEGIRATPAFNAVPTDAVEVFRLEANRKLAEFRDAAGPSEAETEHALVFPILQQLGWYLLPQQGTERSANIPDALLFLNAADATAARKLPRADQARYHHATIVHESKAWDVELDRGVGADRRTPANQAVRYLNMAEERSRGGIRWATLTNGRIWRLYFHGAASKSNLFLEADLDALVTLGSTEQLKTFLLLFRRDSFVPDDIEGRTFLANALRDAERFQERITAALSRSVFDGVFPDLLRALSAGTAQPPAAVRDAALILLYRLLFLLYAEDRDLLPRDDPRYRRVSIARLRRAASESVRLQRPLSATSDVLWSSVRRLFGIVALGSDEHGVPEYNGGLFEPARAPLLDAARIPDATFARILHGLSVVDAEGEGIRTINYRDLSVQQLGAVYERLLEWDVKAEAGIVVPVADDTQRHTIGAYYTAGQLVQLTQRRAISPILAERRAIFTAAVARLATDRRQAAARRDDLARFDLPEAFLSLRICDPALGSGHFLVALVDWLADEIIAAIEEAAEAGAGFGYRSPLADRIEAERARIEAAATLHNWPIHRHQLDDRNIVRRLVLKRCVYGVDVNPLAVELAKLSLWLHSFTVGAPLSFLDHHLRCGDSLFGAWVADTDSLTEGRGKARRGGLALAAPIASAREAARGMARIEDLADADIDQARESKNTFAIVEDATAPLRAFLDCWHARDWLPLLSGKAPAKGEDSPRRARERTIDAWLDGIAGDPVALAAGAAPGGIPKTARAVAALLAELRATAAERRFLHWQPAFPGVWTTWRTATPEGGFDAIIGNPPYVRQEQIKDRKPALQARFPAVYDGVADLYVYFFAQALALLRPGGRFAFVVTNKWLKAGYADSLRARLADAAWVESVVDFGHAKDFFPGTDVMPSVICARRPLGTEDPPSEVSVAVLPRDTVQYAALAPQVAAAGFPLPRAAFTREPWILEPPPVLALLDKLRRAGVPLAEYVGSPPMYGVKTGFNEAFVIDQAKRDALVAADPASAALIKPFLRGEDIGRWAADWAERWMILTPRGTAMTRYPAILNHLAQFRPRLEPKPSSWPAKKEWKGRAAGDYEWFELQATSADYSPYERPKIVYQEIQYHPAYALDTAGRYLNNKGFLIPSADPFLLAALNSPLLWWFNWRHLAHLKDEALTPQGYRVETIPIPRPDAATAARAATLTAALAATTHATNAASRLLTGWYRAEWGIERIPRALEHPFALPADRFAAALKAALPSARKTLSAAAIAAITGEHTATIAPIAARQTTARAQEAELSALVNAAYGLTSEDEALMWSTAPPRMPIPPPAK